MKNLWLCEKGELCEIQGRNPDDKRGLKPTMSLQQRPVECFPETQRHCKKFTSLSLPV